MNIPKYINMAENSLICTQTCEKYGSTYIDFCKELPDLGKYLDKLNGKYDPNFLRLFASCSRYGHDMLREGKKSGVIAAIGDVHELKRSIGRKQRLNVSDGGRILLYPHEMSRLLYALGEEDVDCAIMFDKEGNLRGVGRTLKHNIDEVDKEQFELVMRIKGKNGEPNGTKFPAALYSTSRYGVHVVATSEGKKHATMAFANGRILEDLVFDPSTGLYGQELISSLSHKEI
jgi:hypothetical protein